MITGPTPIPGGDASGEADVTLLSDRLAVGFAFTTAPPWGVPRGGVIDLAEVRDGIISPDRASLLDFLPDSWSKWTDANPRFVVRRESAGRVSVDTERHWQGVRIVTTFTLQAGQPVLQVTTRMQNPGPAAHSGILSGYALWPEGGHLFGLPGMSGRYEGQTDKALAPWSAAYDEGWVLALHAPFADRMQDDGRDRYLRHDLAPGESRSFEAWVQLEPGGSLAPVVKQDILLNRRPSATLSGRVRTVAGDSVALPAVVVTHAVEGRDEPYAWALGRDGRFEFELPAGRYRIHATAKHHAASAAVPIDLAAGEQRVIDFDDLGTPGELSFEVREPTSGRLLDARLTIEEGAKPLIGFFGKAVFFTELSQPGRAVLPLAPGDYTFRVSAAEHFTSKALRVAVAVAPGARNSVRAELAVLADPAARGWFSGDMHHHSDVLDGFTDPLFVMRSQLAAGLDVTLLSDHDSVVNNRDMKRLAAQRGVPFIAGTELSPSWAHFNSYPLDEEAEIGINPGTAPVQAIFAEARRMGADIIQVNHPYQSYGYFYTDENGDIPGGYSDKFDLVEITAADLDANSATLERTWAMWNDRQPAYLSAGSDAHDVWQEVSGSARMMVNVDGALEVERFIAALKRGNAYATTGPLVYPDRLFGETFTHPAGAPLTLGYELHAVNGLTKVRLIERGREIAVQRFEAEESLLPVAFTVTPESDTWYGLIAEDAAGKYLVSNPVWIRLSNVAPAPRNAEE